MFLTQPEFLSAGRSSHIPLWSPVLPLGQRDINLVCRLLLKMTELTVGHLSTRFQKRSLKEAFLWLTASQERGGTAGLMGAAPCPIPSSSWQQASVLLHKGPRTTLSIHTCLHEAQDMMWIWSEILIMDKIT